MASRRKISPVIRHQVAERDGHRCSYCRSPEAIGLPMVIDHIVPLAAGGSFELTNLCLACYRCNQFKGARLTAVDPVTGRDVPFFNPLQQVWSQHFVWSSDGLHVLGQTPCGRAAVEALRLNNERLAPARQIWLIVGLHPPLED